MKIIPFDRSNANHVYILKTLFGHGRPRYSGVSPYKATNEVLENRIKNLEAKLDAVLKLLQYNTPVEFANTATHTIKAIETNLREVAYIDMLSDLSLNPRTKGLPISYGITVEDIEYKIPMEARYVKVEVPVEKS